MPEQPAPKKDYSALYTPIAIVIAGALIAVAAYVALAPKTASVSQGRQPQAVNIKDVKIAGNPYIGKENAPVTMAYWSDYQCPFCKQFETDTLPTLKTKYVDTGKLKIVFKDYPFLGNDSITAAEYEHAIWKLYPAQFFAWREAMYKAQDDEGDQGFGDAASIDQLITSQFSAMNDAKIKADIAANKSTYDAEIDADRTEGANFGIQGTPGFITGKTMIPGAVPLVQFTSAIDPQLK